MLAIIIAVLLMVPMHFSVPISSLFDIDKGSDRKIWIKCQEKDYHDDYPTPPNFYSEGLKLYLNQFMIKDSLNDAKELIKRK